MTKTILLGIVFLVSINVLAQDDKKWSVEANYPISIGDELGNDNPGIVDIGLKYRFADFSFFKLGAGINAGIFHDNIRSFTTLELVNIDETNVLVQPQIFAEFLVPGIQKLRPSLGLGYSIVYSNFNGVGLEENIDDSATSGGFNINLGLSYDISKRVFFQVQYDYIRNRDSFTFEGNTIDVRENLGFLKLGLGFRF